MFIYTVKDILQCVVIVAVIVVPLALLGVGEIVHRAKRWRK